MINATFLPNYSKFGFDFIFSNLKYVVINDLHTYRGAFESHLDISQEFLSIRLVLYLGTRWSTKDNTLELVVLMLEKV